MKVLQAPPQLSLSVRHQQRRFGNRGKGEARVTADEWDHCPRSDWMLLPLHEWLCANPDAARLFDRKLRLYAAACCRQRWELFEADLFRRAVDAAERFADGQADKEELATFYDAIMAIPTPDAQSHCIENMTLKLTGQGGMTCAIAAVMDLAVATGWGDFESVVRAQAPLFRCVVGNPFRPVAFDPSWRTSAVIGLTRAAYDDRAFDQLPILADALQDAGCKDAEVLGHCRSSGPHGRGCWVVDLLLDKK
jgi:hypothetical protein